MVEPRAARRHIEAMLHITLNGEPRQVAPGTVLALVEALGLNPRRVAVERNRDIVPRATHDAVTLADGDEIEIVHFVGGG